MSTQTKRTQPHGFANPTDEDLKPLFREIRRRVRGCVEGSFHIDLRVVDRTLAHHHCEADEPEDVARIMETPPTRRG